MNQPRLTFSFILIFWCCISFPAYSQNSLGVKNVEFKDNKTFSDGDLHQQILMKGISGFKKTILGKQPDEYSEEIEEIIDGDLKRLIHFYQTEGFLNVQIDTPAVMIYEKEKMVNVIYTIHEGEPIRVANVEVLFDPDSSNFAKNMDTIFTEVLKSIKLNIGSRFRDDDLQNDQETILQKFNNEGYPYTEIQPKLNVDQTKSLVEIIWKITPGSECFFGEITITGNIRTDSDKIFKQLLIAEGDLYSQQKIEKSQQRIFALGVFQIVSFTSTLTPQKNKIIPIEINITEAPKLTNKLGIGYGSEDKFRIFINMRRLGIFGWPHRLDLLLKRSAREPHNVDLKWLIPAFFSHKTAFTLNPFFRQENEPGYRVERLGIKTSLLHKITLYLKGSLSYLFEKVTEDTTGFGDQPSNINRDEDLYNKAGPIVGLTFDNSQPLFNPNSGYFVALTLKANGWLVKSEFVYYKILFDIRKYIYLGSIVLATKIKIGNIRPRDELGFIPVEDRFYAGGMSSVRGWSRQELGPKDPTGNPIGGNSLIEGSGELRYPIFNIIAGVAFLDFGNVWIPSNFYKLNDLRYSVGAGIGISTPVGPARIDFAHPIFDEKQTWEVHFTIGHAF
jgi:outer membrane protein insertion porin family